MLEDVLAPEVSGTEVDTAEALQRSRGFSDPRTDNLVIECVSREDWSNPTS